MSEQQEMDVGLDEKKAKTISKYPLAILVFVVTSLLTTAVNRLFTTEDNRSDDCKNQIAYLRERVDKLEKQLDQYTNAIMFKDAQVKNREQVIDSLKMEVKQ
ncbi:hypothetical protein [Sphingobacterium kyonggiense]